MTDKTKKSVKPEKPTKPTKPTKTEKTKKTTATNSGEPVQIQPGMGALPHPGGVAFRVWAPHANQVYVKGDFNDWSDTAHPMTLEEKGYARQVTNSVGHGVVYNVGSFDWQGVDYQLPPHNELVIYEMHIGSFFVKSQDKPGNFDLALEKMDHLKRLGVNVIQVMPVAEFAGDYSWGYNPANIFAVESAYGGPIGF
jgi:1,4-alpha-glucan branching enzyme